MLGPVWKMFAEDSSFFVVLWSVYRVFMLFWQQAQVELGFPWVVAMGLFHYLMEPTMDPTAAESCFFC